MRTRRSSLVCVAETGWVLSLSIGQSCTFFFGTNWEIDHEDTRMVELHSGDAIMLNGQVLHHGVCNLVSDSSPPFWIEAQRDKVIPEHWMRFNLQIRDASTIS